MCVMDQAVQNGIGEGGIPDDIVRQCSKGSFAQKVGIDLTVSPAVFP